jgi:hypothetical protein
MANPIIKILRGATPPSATLQAGQFAVDQVAKNLYLGVEVGGVVTNEIVGGEGTFATKNYVDTAVSNGTGSLGTMSTQDADSVAITGGNINGTTIGATTPSTGKFTSLDVTVSDITMSGSGLIDMNAGRITNLSAPVNANDSVRKTDLDSAISALGSVFHYEGPITSFFVPATAAATQPLDLDTLNQTTGAYYQIDYDYVGNGTNATVELTYSGLATPIKVKAGDAIVKTTTGWQKIDNVDVVVIGTANEISVTGDENTGYAVALATAFKDKVSDLETKTQNIDLAGTTSETTQINGDIKLNGTGGATFIKATPGGRGITVGSSAADEELFLSASGAHAVVSAIGTNANELTLNGSKVNIGGSYDPSVWPPIGNSTDDATEVKINAVTVKGSASGTTTLEDFVIDGGVY